MNARDVKKGQRVTIVLYGVRRPATVIYAPVHGSGSTIVFIRMDDTCTRRWAHAESLEGAEVTA